MSRLFHGGVHPDDAKRHTENVAIEDFGVPSKVVLCMGQHIGAPAEPTVAVGDEVKRGQGVGQSTGFVSTTVHASIAGKVTAVGTHPHPTGASGLAVIIEPGDADEWAEETNVEGESESLDTDALRDVVLNAGIVGMGGAAFPTHVKLSPPKEKPIEVLIINGVECEPFVTADYRLMLEEPERVLTGLKLAVRAVGAKRAIIGIEANKPEAVKVMTERAADEPDVSVVSLPVRYPQGAEKQLIKAMLNREVPSGGLPMDVGVVVQNVATVSAIAEAVLRRRPVTERILTVVGDAVRKPGNFRVRIGTLVSEILTRCEVREDYRRLILGGPMVGLAQATPEVPVTKGTNCILVTRNDDVPAQQPCIRCGRCVEVCPSDLVPSALSVALEAHNIDAAQTFNMTDCIECGCCAYVCPSNRNIVQQVKYGKAELALRRRK